MKRIQCMGIGRPCPAYWYEEPHPGPARKRCPSCEKRRRWLVLERAKKCSVCGKLLIHPVKRGRPRVVCGSKCAEARHNALRRVDRFENALRRFM